jgi:hypothetical protein
MGEKEIQEQMRIVLPLRPASALIKEREARAKKHRKVVRDESMTRAIEIIERAHKAGYSEVTGMTFPEHTVEALRKAGYKVTFQKACGMGDVDTHRIEWKERRKRK